MCDRLEIINRIPIGITPCNNFDIRYILTARGLIYNVFNSSKGNLIKKVDSFESIIKFDLVAQLLFFQWP